MSYLLAIQTLLTVLVMALVLSTVYRYILKILASQFNLDTSN